MEKLNNILKSKITILDKEANNPTQKNKYYATMKVHTILNKESKSLDKEFNIALYRLSFALIQGESMVIFNTDNQIKLYIAKGFDNKTNAINYTEGFDNIVIQTHT